MTKDVRSDVCLFKQCCRCMDVDKHNAHACVRSHVYAVRLHRLLHCSTNKNQNLKRITLSLRQLTNNSKTRSLTSSLEINYCGSEYCTVQRGGSSNQYILAVYTYMILICTPMIMHPTIFLKGSRRGNASVPSSTRPYKKKKPMEFNSPYSLFQSLL